MTTYANIEHNLAFIERRESSAVRQALEAVTALSDAPALKRTVGIPALLETRAAINALEDMVVSLKLESLRHHDPDQLVLDGMEHLHEAANEGGNEPAAAS